MSVEGYITVKQYASYEYEDRKSLFIGEALPVDTEQEALAFIESVRKRYPDANHHVYAYTLRENSITRFSDDREPQGTAGMPVLDVIRKNGCVNVALVVTRYFGGTLLGTGGLVRAYTAAAIGALENAQIIKYDVYSKLSLLLNYSDYGKINSVLADYGFRTEDSDFGAEVKIQGSILKASLDGFIKKMTDVTSARAKITVLEERFDF
ncbi:MAG: YigZ family protein [Clostridia bacterium]|nr:YigZ family protein [Clostridia bacterium]